MSSHVTKVQEAKVAALDAMSSRFSQSRDFIFTDYRGLTVAQITNLRAKLREKKAEYRVIKNRYAKLAFRKGNLPDVSSLLVGPTALALTSDDAGAVAKVLFEFSEESPVTVKGAIIDGRVFDGKQTEAFSKLPSRQVLIAILMGTMKAPVQHLVFALSGVTSKLVRTLKAVADKKAAQAT